MHLVARHATVNDFPTVARVCHGRGESVEKREECWNALWSYGNPFGIVVSDYAARGRPDIGVLIGTFVTDEFADGACKHPEPGTYKRASSLASDGSSPYIPARAIAEKNGTDGLNLLFAHVGWDVKDHSRSPAPSIRAITWGAFLDRHGGNRIRSILGEAVGIGPRKIAEQAGWKVLNSYQEWATNTNTSQDNRPYLLGLSHEDGLRAESPWLVRLFTYFPPRFHFTDHQREILLLAREGFTDNEIAAAIGARSEAIKKRWSGIYERVGEVFPDVLPSIGRAGRGAEKRRALLAHLRDRPEELRPYARRRNGS